MKRLTNQLMDKLKHGKKYDTNVNGCLMTLGIILLGAMDVGYEQYLIYNLVEGDCITTIRNLI